jgi:hypothetical protein
MWRRLSADREARRRSARAALKSRSKKRLWSRRLSLCSSRWFSRCRGSVRLRWLTKARRLRRHRFRRRPPLLQRVQRLRLRPLRALKLRQVQRLRPRSNHRFFSSSDGGTGRRARLRGVWGNPCEFDSRSEHFYFQVRPERDQSLTFGPDSLPDSLKIEGRSAGKTDRPFLCAPGRAHSLGGESPLRTRQGESLAERQGCPSRGGI